MYRDRRLIDILVGSLDRGERGPCRSGGQDLRERDAVSRRHWHLIALAGSGYLPPEEREPSRILSLHKRPQLGGPKPRRKPHLLSVSRQSAIPGGLADAGRPAVLAPSSRPGSSLRDGSPERSTRIRARRPRSSRPFLCALEPRSGTAGRGDPGPGGACSGRHRSPTCRGRTRPGNAASPRYRR